jgi:hypothetical protein
MATHTLFLDGYLPHRLNELLGHWAVAARRKKSDRLAIGYAFHEVGSPRAAGRRRVSLAITLGPGMRGGDPDSFFKSTLDALVACGALLDDRKEAVELGPVTYRRGPRKGLEITLEDL